MSLLTELRKMGGFVGGSFRSKNNRKMTKGRIVEGKSTFKGCQPEHRVVQQEKHVWEKARMMFAIDIKIADASEAGEHTDDLRRERAKIEQKLVDAIDHLNVISSERRYKRFMERLDQEDNHRRDKWNIKAA